MNRRTVRHEEIALRRLDRLQRRSRKSTSLQHVPSPPPCRRPRQPLRPRNPSVATSAVTLSGRHPHGHLHRSHHPHRPRPPATATRRHRTTAPAATSIAAALTTAAVAVSSLAAALESSPPVYHRWRRTAANPLSDGEVIHTVGRAWRSPSTAKLRDFLICHDGVVAGSVLLCATIPETVGRQQLVTRRHYVDANRRSLRT